MKKDEMVERPGGCYHGEEDLITRRDVYYLKIKTKELQKDHQGWVQYRDNATLGHFASNFKCGISQDSMEIYEKIKKDKEQ